MSLFGAAAFELERQARSRWNDYILNAYRQAEIATNGHMLNARGRRAQVEALDLFKANRVTQAAYASDELAEHWARYPIIRWPTWAAGEAMTIPTE